MDDKNAGDLRIRGAEAVSLFCRLHLNTKRELPVRPSEMGLLILVVTSGRPITPVQAASFFGVSKPMVTAMVNSLVKKGYLAREPLAQDRRRYTLKAEPNAAKLVEETCEEYLSMMTLLQERMGRTAFEELIRLMEQANEIIRQA